MKFSVLNFTDNEYNHNCCEIKHRHNYKKRCYRFMKIRGIVTGMEPRLNYQQTQRLVLSPQIRQYLKLLQIPLTELQQTINNELAENPILEEKSSQSVEDGRIPQSPSSTDADHPLEDLHLGETYNGFRQMDSGFMASYSHDEASIKDPHELQKQKNFRESLITKPEGLTEYLFWQYTNDPNLSE